ncbi:MAG: cytosine permease [Marmoricola sp.]
MTNQVNAQASEADLDSAFIGHDDYALVRVPESERYSWFSVALQRFGQLSALAQFFLAAMIGLAMGFWQAMLAITIGAVLLEIVTIFVGIAGQREGLFDLVASSLDRLWSLRLCSRRYRDGD